MKLSAPRAAQDAARGARAIAPTRPKAVRAMPTMKGAAIAEQENAQPGGAKECGAGDQASFAGDEGRLHCAPTAVWPGVPLLSTPIGEAATR